MARFLLCAWLASAFALSAPAQSDPVERQRAMQAIADQKAETSVNEAIAEAQKSAKLSPLAATERLKQAKLGLDLIVLSNAKKGELFKRIDAAIEQVKNPNAPPPAADPAAGVKAERKQVDQAMKQEVADVAAGIADVAKLNAEGRTREAEFKAAELAKRYPNNPAAYQLVEKGSMAEKIAMSRDLARMQNERVLYVYNDVMRSTLPVKGDVEFPADWKERTKNRGLGEKLSPETEAIIKALDKSIPTQLQSMPFEEAVQSISNEINQPIYLDKKSIEEIPGFDMKRPTTPLSVPRGTPLSARTMLRAMLQSQGLTFVVRDNIIQVVTIEKAQAMLTTKAYYIGDIVQAAGPFGGAARWGTFLDYQQTEQNVKYVVDAIRGVDPLAWRERTGGVASVTFHYPSMSIIVKAPAEVHATLSDKFKSR
jgi:hypothetical protein